jgi:hypothetical protein
MEAARPELKLVDPATGELVPNDLAYKIRDLEDQLAGYKKTCDKQAREIGVLTRKVQEDADPSHHPKGKEIVALIERWMRVTGHTRSKVSDDRVKLVKARLRDGYTFEQLELAVDGIGALPYVVNGSRKPTGTDSQRHDRLGIALGGGEKVEEFARLGYRARNQGWSVEDGWPEQEENR